MKKQKLVKKPVPISVPSWCCSDTSEQRLPKVYPVLENIINVWHYIDRLKTNCT